ncbi:phage head closure protein [Rhizomicrobium electricum]|uniref:Head-tail adaptor protein n=1 Tax=Rhizomicrobium electricum TaxID=480070 RepID=A0ABN1EHM1_9PROT|nr:phage head closure protein [Rhizomicrobium electricum]NIJ48431.1 SPP1 family predicted phage head-tail adaptor [Rhizomicrobium electricum]
MLAHLKQRATLLSRVVAPDGGGGFSESWQSVGQAWVRITPLGTSEKFGADALQTRIRHRLVTRARDDIVDGMRLAVGERSFAVHAVLGHDATDAYLTLMCEELP